MYTHVHTGRFVSRIVAVAFVTGIFFASSFTSFAQVSAFKVDSSAANTILNTFSDGGFVLQGTHGTGSLPAIGGGTRFLWLPRKTALRSGRFDASYWNLDSIGTFSTALGFNTVAKGTGAFAAGYNSAARGNHAVVLGRNNAAGGDYSIATGRGTTAAGDYSMSMGYTTTAGSLLTVAIGQHNVGGGTGTAWVSTDPLFEIGNGTSTTPANALTVLKNGNVGIGTATPDATLEINGLIKVTGGSPGTGKVLTSDAGGTAAWTERSSIGVTLDQAYDFGGPGAGRTITADTGAIRIQGVDGFVVEGTFNSGTIPATGNGTRLMFFPGKAAFRAGYVNGYQWNNDSVGIYSVATGSSTVAKGSYSTATGAGTRATGMCSTAAGDGSTANGYAATAMGGVTSADANFSSALGYHTDAGAYASTAIGRYNVGGGSAGSWVATDPLFEIGNGTGVSPANAMTVLKNAYVGIRTASPTADLHIKGDTSSNAVLFIEPGEWNSIGDYGKLILGSSDHYIRGEYNFGLTLYDTDGIHLLGSNVGINTGAASFNLEVNGTAGKPGGGNWSNSSDARLKNVEGGYERGLEDIVKLRSIRFHYKPGNPRHLPSETEEIGFVAQEVKEVFPECVTEGKDGYLDFNIHAINVALVNAVRELNEQLKTERDKTASMQSEVTTLKALVSDVNELKEEFSKLKAVFEKMNGTKLATSVAER